MFLKSYEIDWKYPHWKVKYNQKKANQIAFKLARHFKIDLRGITFRGYKIGWASYSNRIKLPKINIPLGIISHEIGHLLSFKYGHTGHNKKAYRYIKRVYKYSFRYIPSDILLNIDYNKKLLIYTAKEE